MFPPKKIYFYGMQAHPLVSIVLVNYNQPGLTVECLHSLQGLDYPNWEVVVVDNGSTTDWAPIQAAFPKVPLLVSKVNLGFAGGNNLALDHARGAYLFFLNNDTTVEPNVVSTLVDFFQRHPNCGLVSPRIHYAAPPYLIQYAGATPINRMTIRNEGIGWKEEDTGQYRDERMTEHIHGAAMMMPREVLEIVGPMREDYFLYYEELDWTERVKKAGFTIWYCGTSCIWHKESAATGNESPLKVYYLNRNRLLFARRNYTPLQVASAWMFYSFVSLPVHFIKYVTKRRFDLAKALMKAYVWNLTHRP